MLVTAVMECSSRNADGCAYLWQINWCVRIVLQELLKPPHHRRTVMLQLFGADETAREALDHDLHQLLLHRPANLRMSQNVGHSRCQPTGYHVQMQQPRHQMRRWSKQLCRCRGGQIVANKGSSGCGEIV